MKRLALALVLRRVPPVAASVYGQSCRRVVQLNVSQGGVPKRPVPSVQVAERGIFADYQADRKHHGGPDQALCLYCREILEALQAEGHSIYPGAAGENVTTEGVDWNLLKPGRRFRLGSVVAEFSSWAVPCATIRGCFVGGKFNRISHKRHPGWSRAYAYVRSPGEIRVGDCIEWLD